MILARGACQSECSLSLSTTNYSHPATTNARKCVTQICTNLEARPLPWDVTDHRGLSKGHVGFGRPRDLYEVCILDAGHGSCLMGSFE